MALQLQISEDDLPVLSAVATQALELTRKENVTHRQIEELIRNDMSLTQRVLHIANSPFFAGRVQSQTISGAVARLGLRQLRQLIIAAASEEVFDANDPVTHILWDHSIATAIASNLLATALGTAHADEAYIAGILHDVGKLVIYRQHKEIYGDMLGEAVAVPMRIHQLEQERFEFFNHMSVGGLAILKWKLSETVAEAARFHHEVETSLDRRLVNTQMTCIVSVASLIANSLGFGWPTCDCSEMDRKACVQHLGLSLERLEKIREQVKTDIESQRGAMV